MTDTNHNRYLGDTFGEFFGALEFLSGNRQQDMAAALGVDNGAYSRWRRDLQIPRSQYDETLIAVCGLTETEIANLRQNSVSERRRLQVEAPKLPPNKQQRGIL